VIVSEPVPVLVIATEAMDVSQISEELSKNSLIESSTKPDKTSHSQTDDAHKCTQPNTYRDEQETTREREGEIDSRLFDLENGGVYRLASKPKRNNRAAADSWVKGRLKR
jgi:hypothetical protein